jgi:biopolymer transport protein ExbD
MRVPSTRDSRSQSMDVNMTPMIDMVFLLIVYFVWTSSMQAKELLLPSKLSPLQGSQPVESDLPPPPEMDFEPIVIRIVESSGKIVWQMNEVPFPSAASLKEELVRLAKFQRGTAIVIHPDPSVPIANVIDAYDAARRAGFSKVQFTATDLRDGA